MLIDWLQQRMTVVWLAYFAGLEILSWAPSSGAPCIVKTSAQYAKDTNGDECPALHVFLIESSAIVFEKLGDPHTATAVFTALLFVATFFLWLATRNLVRGVDRTAERQLRAYVTAIGGQMKLEGSEDGMTLEVKINIKNSGQTPACRFNTWLDEPKVYDIDACPWDSDEPPPPNWNFAGVLGPGSTTYVAKTIPITRETIDEVSAGKKLIYVLGQANYLDIFGGKRTHIFRNSNAAGRVKNVGQSWGLRSDGDEGD